LNIVIDIDIVIEIEIGIWNLEFGIYPEASGLEFII